MNKPISSKVTSDPMDIWSSILHQKNIDEASQLKTPPYIHPLDKKSRSYLSEKSLEMCTESLGSETGSDWFSSSYTLSSSSSSSSSSSPSSEDTNSEDDGKMRTCLSDDNPKHNNSYSLKNKKKPRCIPPLLPSLTSQSKQLQMRSHRNNGRLLLFLQAVVSVPSHNNFIATRQNGRLTLTFANHAKEEIAEEDESLLEQPNARSLELVVNKSPKWSEKFNTVTNFKNVKFVQHGSLPRSLPLSNAYQYYWRTKATGNVDQENSNGNKVVVYGNMNIYQVSQELLVQNMKLCKDSRTTTSFLFWDPCCIAT